MCNLKFTRVLLKLKSNLSNCLERRPTKVPFPTPSQVFYHLISQSCRDMMINTR